MDTLSAYYDERVKEYKKYISNHIANIKKCYNIYGKDLCNILNVDFDELGKLVEIHDLSKYSEEEFEGIRSYYFPTPSEESDEELRGFRKSKYNAAWLHHLRNNPHHPEYWMHSNTDDENFGKCDPMKPIYIAEMLLDWAALSIFFKSTAYIYWHDSIHIKPMDQSTRDLVDKCIELFKDPISESA